MRCMRGPDQTPKSMTIKERKIMGIDIISDGSWAFLIFGDSRKTFQTNLRA